MLKKLYIRNYALIEELDVDFEGGLNIITGETGAGKSIIMDALGLILGSRAESDALQDKSQKCVVEAVFETDSKELWGLLNEKGYDSDGTCIIRREIALNGKSRSFINDTPATVQLIREITAHLVDIHSQHETLDIANSLNQFQVIDSFAGTVSQAEKFAEVFAVYKSKRDEFKVLTEEQERGQKEIDYHQFLFDELENAKLQAGEELGLEAEIEKLSNADQIKVQLSQAFQLMDNPQGTNAVLKELSNLLSKIKLHSEDFASLRTRVDSSLVELRDIASELESLAESTVNDPALLEKLEERSDLLNNLMSKHRVKSVEELMAIREDLSGKLEFAGGLGEKIEKLEKEIQKLEKQLRDDAEKLMAARKKQVPALEKQISVLLSDLNMPHARLVVNLETSKELNINGNAVVEFLFSANKGSDPKPIQKVASGGEFSRLMLTIKSLMANRKDLQTMIFDEIDAGVSGEVAGKMGEIMKKMSRQLQVFAITHLPQVAVKGQHHYKVVKHVQGNKTISKLVKLDPNNRVEEIAKMLSGEKITPEALANAKVLLQ